MTPITFWLVVFSGLFIVACVVIGVFGMKRTKKESEDYYTSAGGVGTLTIFFTLYATINSAWTFLGLGGGSFTMGIVWPFMPTITAALIWSGFYYFMARRSWVLARQYGYITPSDFLAHRYESQFMRVLISVISIVFLVPFMGMQIMGVAYLYEGLSGGQISYLAGVLIFIGITALYTTIGGFRAVAWTDVLQGIIMFVLIVLGLVTVVSAVAGVPEIVSKGGIVSMMDAMGKLDLLGWPGGRNYWTYQMWLFWIVADGAAILVMPQIFIRYFAARSLRTVTTTARLMPLIGIFTYFPPAIIGFLAVVAMPGLKNPDMSVPLMVAQFVGAALAAGVAVGALAGCLSTLDSQLLAGGSLFSIDLVKKTFKPTIKDSTLFQWDRICVIVWSLFAVLIAIYRPALIVLISRWTLAGFCLGVFLPAMGALFWPRATKQGAIAGSLTGLGIWLFMEVFWKNPFGLGLFPFFWGFFAEVIVFFWVCFKTAPPSPEIVKRFYDDVELVLDKYDQGEDVRSLVARRQGEKI